MGLGRGMIGNKIKKIFKDKQVKELYVKVRSPEEYQKLVRKGVSLELADVTFEKMERDKKIREQQEYIQSLEGKLKKEEDEEIQKQKKAIEKHKKSNEFVILFNPEKPLTLVSSFNAEPYADQYGKKRPFWVGIKLVASPYGPYIVPILSDKPKNFDEISCLEMSPQLYPYKICDFFTDLKLLVHKMKASGIVEANVSPEGLFISDQMQVQVELPQPRITTTGGKKKGKKGGKEK